MKIAIPTDDAVHIRENFCYARAFLILNVEHEIVTSQEIRWNYLSQILTSPMGCLFNLADCDAVVVDQIDGCKEELLKRKGMKVFTTKVVLLTQIKEEIQNLRLSELQMISHTPLSVGQSA
jgi:predicted Fe-Mo cluster-binding NifX family protein